MNVRCPDCLIKVPLSASFPGAKVSCPACNKEFVPTETKVAPAITQTIRDSGEKSDDARKNEVYTDRELAKFKLASTLFILNAIAIAVFSCALCWTMAKSSLRADEGGRFEGPSVSKAVFVLASILLCVFSIALILLFTDASRQLRQRHAGPVVAVAVGASSVFGILLTGNGVIVTYGEWIRPAAFGFRGAFALLFASVALFGITLLASGLLGLSAYFTISRKRNAAQAESLPRQT